MSVEEYSRSLVAAIYARRSKVGDDTLSVDNQVAHLKKYAKRMGYRIDEKLIFVDNGYSAYSGTHRPAFEEMMLVAKDEHRPMDVILVHMFDRFYRNVDEATIEKAILRSRYNVDVKSSEEELPDDPMMARIMEVITDSAGEKYSAKLSKRVRQGHRALAIAGYWTTNKPPYGYRLLECQTESGRKSKRLVIHDQEASIVRQAFELAERNFTATQILRTLPMNITEAHLRKLLKNQHYIGSRIIREKKNGPVVDVIERTHSAIIDKQVFDKVQINLKRRSKKYPYKNQYTSNSPRIFSGMIQCYCGYKLKASCGKTNSDDPYYYCNALVQKRKHAPTKGVTQKRLLSLIYDKLSSDLLSESVIEQAIQDIKSQRKNSVVAKAVRQLKNSLEKNKMRQDRLKKSVEIGIMSLDEIKERMDDAKEEALELELKISLSYEPTDQINVAEIKQLARSIKRRLKSANFNDQYDAIRQIVSDISIDYPWITFKVSFLNIQEEYRVNYHPEPNVPVDIDSLTYEEVRKLAGDIRRFTFDQNRNSNDDRKSRANNEDYIYAYRRQLLQNKADA